MKKIISMLLVLVLSLGMLSGITMAADFEMPEECTEADAGVMVTSSEDSSMKHYFETLSQDLFNWVCQQVPGTKTVTVLKDLDLSNITPSSGSRLFQFDATQANWYGRNGTKYPLVIDLGGNTLTYTGGTSVFFLTRYGMTLKNGTLIYNGTENRAPFVIGTSTGKTAISSGATLYAPELNIENATIVNTREKLGYVVYNHVHGTKLTIKDSTLWANNGNALMLGATDQTKDVTTRWEGDFSATVEIVNSTVGVGGGHPISTLVDDYEITIEDSIIVTNSEDGQILEDGCEPTVDDKGADVREDEEWFDTLVNGQEVSGKAFFYGDAGKEEPLPFEDVAETDWFHDFVKELYNKKVVAGQTATTFAPNANLTYAAALKLLVVGLTGKDPGNASGHWAANYLAEAKNAGWTDIDTAKLDAPITREAFCEIAAKAAALTEGPAVNPFTDTENASVLALVKAGVINGMSADKFAPTGILTRAQISKIISLLLKLK